MQRLRVGGMHGEFCVNTTVRRALALSQEVLWVSDGRTLTGNVAITAQQMVAHHNATLVHIGSFGPTVQAQAASQIHGAQDKASTSNCSCSIDSCMRSHCRRSGGTPMFSKASPSATVTPHTSQWPP